MPDGTIHYAYHGLGHTEADFVAGENRRGFRPDAIGHVVRTADISSILRRDINRLHRSVRGSLPVEEDIVSSQAPERGDGYAWRLLLTEYIASRRSRCRSPTIYRMRLDVF